ncbi:IS5 family transposase [Stenotrophomonas nitritireducens]|uniref:Transposase n=1 Tax=Stenotrophomonas nitritireducens TaxID=83617 RepID=A0ABR5NIH9_9GAMM|nr:IS5 family transposase [Stenotrophomonas nitritireducens]KRG56480.1 transposase [Stenotrophomonas nitritireducens]
MSQISFSDAEYAGKRKKTRREVFLEEMEQVVPWKALLKVLEPHYPVAGRGRRPYPLDAMLRVHLMQNWFALSDPAMEEALYEIASLRNFAGLSLSEPIPDETTILNFRHMLEESDLAEDIFKQVNAHLSRKGLLLKRGSIVDATIIAAPSSTKNAEGERDPEMHQTKKGNQWHFGMKAHIGVDADSGLVHTVTTTAANEADVEQVADLLHGKEEQVWADSGYRGAQSRVQRDDLRWHIAARPSDIAKLPEGRAKARLQKSEHRNASVRAKVEHPFRVIKRQFGLMKVRFRGLQKNTAHLLTLFALSNLWMARRQLMPEVRPKAA